MVKELITMAGWYSGKWIDHPYSKVPPFSPGVGRSGTTALRLSLGLHPKIVTTWPRTTSSDLLATGLRNCTYPSRKASMQMSQRKYDKTFRNTLLRSFSAPALFSPLPKAWMAHSDITLPLAGYLRQLFPALRIVYIVRNGIEVVSSRMLFEGFKDRPFEWQCEVWAKAAEMIRWGATQDHFFLIRHEELLSQNTSSRVLDNLWSFLGLKPEQRCADALRNQWYHPTKSPLEAAEVADNPQTRAQRWRFWNEAERQCFIDHCAEAMTFLGYDLPWHRGQQSSHPPAIASALGH
jgi:hypothetical protein